MTRFALMVLTVVGLGFHSAAQLESAWKIYSAKGKSISEKAVVKQLSKAEVVFFGEEHDNQVAHYLTLKLLVDFIHQHENPVFALEMFETDQQEVLDQLLAGDIEIDDLAEHTRLWNNFSDYQPMMDTALSFNTPIVASNIPRPWASALFHGGRDSLAIVVGGDTALVCPLDFQVDFTLSQYANLEEMAVHFGDKNFLEAQAVKDATMAKMIVKALDENQSVFHLNGCYHSDFHQSIVWYLKQARPDVSVMTISVVSAATLEWNSDWNNKADIVIVIDEAFPRSY